MHTTVVLAMSVDGKIADVFRHPARFSSSADQAHLEKQIAQADGVLFGANTLRAYETTLSVSNPVLLQQRAQNQLSPQPVQIVCSQSTAINPQSRFFKQPVPRWLLTTAEEPCLTQEIIASERLQTLKQLGFERIVMTPSLNQGIDWTDAFHQLTALGLQRLAVLGGGELVASLLSADLIDEFWLTVCPLILGGATAPTPVQGSGFLSTLAPRLTLLSVDQIDQEVFLHYQLNR